MAGTTDSPTRPRATPGTDPASGTVSGATAPGALHLVAEHAGDAPRPDPAAPALRRLRGAALLQSLAALLWLPQAAALAWAAGNIADGTPASAALVPAAIVLVLGVLRSLVDGAGTRRAFRAAREVLTLRRDRAVAALAARSPLDTGRTPSGTAASIIAEQAETVLPYLSRFRPVRLKATLVPLAILAAVIPVSWAAALVLLVAAPLIPVFMALIGWRAKAASEAQLAGLGDMNGLMLDRLRGLATIRSLGATDRAAGRLRQAAETLRRRTMAVLRIAFLSSAVLELFAALGVAMVAVYIGFHLLGQLNFGAWGTKLTLGEGLFILLLAPAFFEPLRELSAVWHDRASGQAAMKALDDLADAGMPLLGATGAAARSAAPVRAPSVTVTGLGFTHAGAATPVFAGFDLDIAPGARVALFGPSGCGKSTLLSLIAGLAPAAEGEIAIGGRPLCPQSAASLRSRMAWIGQQPHLFAGTLRGNVRLGRAGVDDAAIDAALDTAALGAVAAAHGAAPVGEGGTGLSGGEALRLALARAAADPGATLLLADEPTAHLNAETAAEVREGLLRLARGRTLVVATHDPALAGAMDRVIAMEDAR